MKKIILLLFAVLAMGCNTEAQKKQVEHKFEIQKSDTQWKAELKPQEFQVLRHAATEQAFTSPLLNVSEPGVFVCSACGNPLYRTKNKFKSGTGWPSFDRAISNENVVYLPGKSGGYSAIEVICAKCGGHIGHIFNDGPKETTGKRHCVNGIAMNFIPDSAEK